VMGGRPQSEIECTGEKFIMGERREIRFGGLIEKGRGEKLPEGKTKRKETTDPNLEEKNRKEVTGND